ncbi:ankyrin repeat-containing domain protein [Aspergillus germanicus]
MQRPTVRYLVENGADIAVKKGVYTYVICAAAWAGDLEIFELLVARGADLEAIQRSNLRPVHFATYSPQVLQVCLDRGVDITVRDSLGHELLHIAALHGNAVSARLLLDAGANINAVAANGATALLLAVEDERRYDVLVFLLSQGADTEIADSMGRTPLISAAALGKEETVRTLLKHGASTKPEMCYGYTALLSALRDPGYPRIVQILLKHEAEVDHRDINGLTALRLACNFGDTEIISILLEHGADVDAADPHGMTPLLQVASGGLEDARDVLLQHGADIHQYDDLGESVLDCAVQGGQHDFVQYLLEKDVLAAPIPAAMADLGVFREDIIKLTKAIYARDVDEVGAILRDIPSENLKTVLQVALHASAIAGSPELTKLLLEKRASARNVASYQRTALHYAAFSGHFEIVKLLLEADADPYAQDLHHSLSLNLAIKNGLENRDTVMHLIKHYGFGPDYSPATPALIETWKTVAGDIRGTYRQNNWKPGAKDDMTLTIVPWDKRKDEECSSLGQPPTFVGTGSDGEGDFEIYGSLHGDDQVIWAQLYEKRRLGWLWCGKLDADTRTITGRLGTNAQLLPGTFTLTRDP